MISCANKREVKKCAVVKATTEKKKIGETTTFGEELIQLNTKSTIELIVIWIEEKTRKFGRKLIDLVVIKIDIMVDVLIKWIDEKSKKNHEKINKVEEEVDKDEEHKGITLNIIKRLIRNGVIEEVNLKLLRLLKNIRIMDERRRKIACRR